MSELSKKDQLDKLVDNGFISDHQVKGFDKLNQEELSHLLSVSEVIKSLEAEKAEVESQRDEALAKLTDLDSEKKPKAVKKEPGVSFTLRSEKYKFKDTAPKKIRYDNQVFTQDELVKNEDYLIELVGGNSSLIEKI